MTDTTDGLDDVLCIWVDKSGCVRLLNSSDLDSEAARFTPDSLMLGEPEIMQFDPLAYDPFMDRPSPTPPINWDRAAMYGPGFRLDY